MKTIEPNRPAGAWLTKRELISAMALQGLLMYPHVNGDSFEAVAKKACRYAEALINELEKVDDGI